MTDGEFNVRYTNKDIMDKLGSIHGELTLLKVQATKTNGSVKGHSRSIGNVRKLVYGAYGFTLVILGFFVGYISMR